MHDTNKIPDLSDARKKQRRNLIILLSSVAAILMVLYWVMNSGTDQNVLLKDKKIETVPFKKTSEVSPQALWMERAQNDLKMEQQKTNSLEQKIEKMETSESQKTAEFNSKYQEVEAEIKILKNTESEEVKPSSQVKMSGGNIYKGQVFPSAPAEQNTNEVNGTQGIDNDELHLKSINEVKFPKKNPETFVPAGTFAEAIMLGAADASAGVTSQSNPSPMLFRVVANGTMPNHYKSHLKDCVVTAAVVGDISSERGEIRLERLSCIFPDGHTVEQPVEGTIFGGDSKNGVRGKPHWGEGDLLARAAAAGALSGLANGISQSYTTNSISPLGSTQTVDNGAIFKHGLAGGASNAMEKLADYNIRRAEQYHPVIQITAGQSVDVVFLKGFYLDGKKHDDLEEDNHSQPELFPSTSTHSVDKTGLTLSERDLQKIKQHENDMGWVHARPTGDTQ